MKEGYSLFQELSLSSDYNSLVDIENMVNDVCEKLHLPEDTYGNILIALTEAVNNAIEHGNQKKKELPVVVKVYDHQKGFCINVKDPTSPENILKEDGRGIFLMKNLADEVEFHENGNSVSIFFNK